MKPEQLFEAVSYVDEDLLLSSENGRGEEKKPKGKIIYRNRWSTLAACACLLLVIGSGLAFRVIGGGSGSSSSTTDSAEYDEELTVTGNSDAAGSDAASDEGSSGPVVGMEAPAENLWLSSEGYDYEELTAENAADYGITEEALTEIPGSEIGETVGTIEDASDESLIGGTIYRSVSYDDLYIVETADGCRYFIQL